MSFELNNRNVNVNHEATPEASEAPIAAQPKKVGFGIAKKNNTLFEKIAPAAEPQNKQITVPVKPIPSSPDKPENAKFHENSRMVEAIADETQVFISNKAEKKFNQVNDQSSDDQAEYDEEFIASLKKEIEEQVDIKLQTNSLALDTIHFQTTVEDIKENLSAIRALVNDNSTESKSIDIYKEIFFENKNDSVLEASEINMAKFDNILEDKNYLVKANHAKNKYKFINPNKISNHHINDINVIRVTKDGLTVMSAEQEKIHRENLGVYAFSSKHVPAAVNINEFKQNFHQDNIFICTNDQFDMLNQKLMKQLESQHEKKDDKIKKEKNNSGNQELHPKSTDNKKEHKKIDSSLSLKPIIKFRSRKVDHEKDEAAARTRDNNRYREKKETLEREINKKILEKIDTKVQENNKPRN